MRSVNGLKSLTLAPFVKLSGSTTYLWSAPKTLFVNLPLLSMLYNSVPSWPLIFGSNLPKTISVFSKFNFSVLGFFFLILLLPFIGIISSYTRLSLRKHWYRLQEQLGILTRVMDENLSGVRLVRSFMKQKYELDKYSIASQVVKNMTFRQITIRSFKLFQR